MIPGEIDTKMRLFNHVNIETEGTMLFHHDHEIGSDIISATAIDLIPQNISCITFLTHGGTEGTEVHQFWPTLAKELVMTVSIQG